MKETPKNKPLSTVERGFVWSGESDVIMHFKKSPP